MTTLAPAPYRALSAIRTKQIQMTGAVQPKELPTALSPITTFMQGAAKALLRARKAFLKADLHICSVGPGDAAPGFKVSEAQLATFAKSQDLSPGQRSHAARAMEGADLRCRCSHQPLSNGREADKAPFRCDCAKVGFGGFGCVKNGRFRR